MRNSKSLVILIVMAMMLIQPVSANKISLGEWGDAWKQSKKEFEKKTGKKKPAKTIFKSFRKDSGISSALKSLDKAYKNVSQASTKTEKLVDAYEKAISKYDAKRKNYLKTLKKAEKKEKGEDSAWNNAIKVLKKDLDAYSSMAKGQLSIFKATLTDGSGKLNAKIFKQKEVLLNLLEGTIKKAERFEAQFKSNPDKFKTSFDGDFKTVCRDMTQNLANINKQIKSDEVQYQGPLFVQKFLDVLEPIGNDQKVLGKDATNKERSDEVARIMKTVDDLSDWLARN